MNRDCYAVEAAYVSEKGPANYAVQVVIAAVKMWGLNRIVLAADGEPAIQSRW